MSPSTVHVPRYIDSGASLCFNGTMTKQHTPQPIEAGQTWTGDGETVLVVSVGTAGARVVTADGQTYTFAFAAFNHMRIVESA